MENVIYYEYLDKVLGEIQPKLYETEQDMRGKMLPFQQELYP
jgi:hypothetical protein